MSFLINHMQSQSYKQVHSSLPFADVLLHFLNITTCISIGTVGNHWHDCALLHPRARNKQIDRRQKLHREPFNEEPNHIFM